MVMELPITQSNVWQTLQNDLKEQSFFEKNENYQFLAIKKHTPAGNYLYLPYGPVADSPSNMKKAISHLEKLAQTENCVFIRIEPQLEHPEKYLPKTAKKTKDLSPKETSLLDLTGSDEDLKARLPSRLLRYYRNHEKQGITIRTSKDPNDIKYLLSLQQALASKKGINTFSEEYLQTELKQPFATLYLVEYDVANEALHQRVTGQEGAPQNVLRSKNFGGGEDPAGPAERIIAAGLVFDHGKTRYNLQGAQTEDGRKLHATGILTIKLILDAKAKGQEIFDFWGIAPEDAPDDHPWKGFTAFKKTFAGYEKDYAGTYDIVLQSAKYKLYKLLRKANRTTAKLKSSH